MTAAQVRRTVLAAQGLAAPRPSGRVDVRHVRRVAAERAVVQLDSVNVLVRAHHVPFFSRLGPHDLGLLDRVAYEERAVFEYWGHEASLLDVELEPMLRWRKARTHRWHAPNAVASRRPDLVDALERAVHDQGPLSGSEAAEAIGASRDRQGAWWGWDDVKKALEYLFWTGRVGGLRRAGFERAYCHPARAVPAEVLARPTPPEDEARAELLVVAARLHGVATAADLADVWRFTTTEARALLPDLVGDGRLEQVDVVGWDEPAYRHPDATVPRTVDACCLVSPFDQAMWHRDRVERVHGFRYRIEIYVPEAQRVHGYYVLPFLLGDTFVARVDLKADRASRRLLVRAAFVEPDVEARGSDPGEVAERLAGELGLLAAWLDLDDVVVEPRGDLAGELAGALRRPPRTPDAPTPDAGAT